MSDHIDCEANSRISYQSNANEKADHHFKDERFVFKNGADVFKYVGDSCTLCAVAVVVFINPFGPLSIIMHGMLSKGLS